MTPRLNRGGAWTRAATAVFIAASVVPRPALAYVDPGIVGSLYQAAYALVFGLLAAWVFRPWRYFKGLASRWGGRSRSLPTDTNGDN